MPKSNAKIPCWSVEWPGRYSEGLRQESLQTSASWAPFRSTTTTCFEYLRNSKKKNVDSDVYSSVLPQLPLSPWKVTKKNNRKGENLPTIQFFKINSLLNRYRQASWTPSLAYPSDLPGLHKPHAPPPADASESQNTHGFGCNKRPYE